MSSPVTHHPEAVDVIIVGGGPFGLVSAIELGRRNVSVCLLEQGVSTSTEPKANATQARTMEHYRRLGFADEIRARGLPADFPTDVAYFTRFSGYELARFGLPSANQARTTVRERGGSWSAAELPHRVAQKFVEEVLFSQAAALPSVDLSFGWRVTQVDPQASHAMVSAVAADSSDTRVIRGTYLLGGDGAQSLVRQTLGIPMSGEAGRARDFFGGTMLAVHLVAPDFYRVVEHPPAWMNVTFNRDRRAFMCPVDGLGEFAFHTQLRPGEDPDAIDTAEARRMFHAAVGRDLDTKVLSIGTWTAGRALVADRFRVGNVFLGGDAAHLFTPTGGLGYNTAVDDAVNLAWKLAAMLQGSGGADLLASYEDERRPIALRNTAFARSFADSIGSYTAVDQIEEASAIGAQVRAEAGAYLNAHARAEFDIPGITFGARYDASPIIVHDGSEPPPDLPNVYHPSAAPGGRPPHLWSTLGGSLFDHFGRDWTLLVLDGRDTTELERLAETFAIDVTVLHVPDPEAIDLYERSLVLIRPDQVVAWRGDADSDVAQVVLKALGHRSVDGPIGAALSTGGRR